MTDEGRIFRWKLKIKERVLSFRFFVSFFFFLEDAGSEGNGRDLLRRYKVIEKGAIYV